METKDFDLGDILSVTHDRLVSPRHMEGVYDILGFMSGESLFTHQLPRVAQEAKPLLLRQHPRLAEIDASAVTTENWRAWLDDQYARFGRTLPVAPMAAGEHKSIDPLAEAASIFGAGNIIVVEPR